MKKIITFLLVFLMIPAFSQNEKKIKKAVKTYNEGKVEKGISMMQKITYSDNSSKNWNMLVTMYYYRYIQAKENNSNEISKLLMQSLTSEDNTFEISYSDVDAAFNDLINKSREACLNSESTTASQFIRNLLVDEIPDSNVVDEALEVYEKAEKLFMAKDYKNAKILYLQAKKIKPDFYKATIYTGDCFWTLEDMDSAIYYFKEGIAMQPNLLEPRKYLVDAFAFNKQDEEAKKECYNALFLYPDESMFVKYADLVENNNKKFNKHWIKRACWPNSMEYTGNQTTDKNWSIYQNAKNDIKDFCDSNGIINKPTNLTKSKYLEVYSWEKMLSTTSNLPDELLFAKKMSDKGYLDCYVFLSCFQYDFFPQYLDFVKENKNRIIYYIENFLVE